MINGTWLVLLLGSCTSLQSLLQCSLAVILLSVAIWTHTVNHDRTNNSGDPLFGQIINEMHVHCDNKRAFASLFITLKGIFSEVQHPFGQLLRLLWMK